MLYLKKILLVLIGFLTFIGCEEILNQEPSDSFSEENIWGDIDLVRNYVWDNYNALGSWGVKENGRATPQALTDDAYNIFDQDTWVVVTGSMSPDAMGAFFQKWSTNYRYIRNVNIFLNNIGDVEADQAVKDRLTGEMKYIRAWDYAELLSFFGGVPIIEEVFELNSEFNVERDSYQDGIAFVVNELDEAAALLPETVPSNEWGRVTKGAALSLKSRVLLHAASILHDPSTEPSGPLYDYDKSNKWQEAADAAKEVIDMGLYSLVEVENWQDYQEMFLHNTPEIIFAHPNHSQFRPNVTQNIDLINTPNGYNGWSGNVPVQDLIDDFQMEDGQSIEESDLYDPSPENIYKNRELRFYADIVYQGAQYRGRETQFYEPGGLDSRDGPQAWNYSRTAYTMRKYMDEDVEFTSTQSTTPYIYFRLAELYLNYAEAQYHVGNEEEARRYVNMIRNRVNLPDIQSSGEELLDDIKHERRIELVFEGWHRYDDLRRWMMGEELGEDIYGMSWRKVNEQGEPTVDGELTYELVLAQEREFRPRNYYVPIPRDEIDATGLQQNWNY
ncbi:Starch-binding associating with outer membrane [Fodinibius roseus]|uniref:Starch-binding associating with outer membrane n=1 Tax=Fodinibius roseus TaxID=1194090 RepID=A0A1M5L0L8_9BACT|nr:RagB/SusD family nutrient uptake outer membrane protein [Fodinibius roseus]SHG58557.1 Starch-binding associating with outer membrane [Fodinibius roseus]